MRNVCLAAVVCMLIAAAPASQPTTTQTAADEADPPKIYRMRAGQPGRDGWYPARSTGGGFTVLTPLSFNDLTVSGRDQDGMRVTTHMVASVDPNGWRYTASASTSPGVKLPANAVALYVEILSTQGNVQQKRSAKLDGADATEIEVRKGKMVVRYRVAQRDDVIYSLSVEAFGREFPPASDAAARKFFESFHFPVPETDDSPARRAAGATAASMS